jgi:hypothetical protein
MSKYSVFISRKSSDAKMAKEIYDFLTIHGISAFDSDISLHEIGITEYQTTIDAVLDNAEHIIVVGSSVENINSAWVKTEWESFENERRSGRKKGNILVVISKKVRIDALPLTLRQKQVFIYEDKKQERLLPYLGAIPKKTEEVKTKSKKHIILSLSIFLTLLIAGGTWYFSKNTVTEIKKEQKQNTDSIFNTTKKQFLLEGLDKEVAFKSFRELILKDIKYVEKAREVFDEKAKTTPVLKEKYMDLSEKLLIYADSVYKTN